MFQYVHMNFAPEHDRLVRALRPLFVRPRILASDLVSLNSSTVFQSDIFLEKEIRTICPDIDKKRCSLGRQPVLGLAELLRTFSNRTTASMTTRLVWLSLFKETEFTSSSNYDFMERCLVDEHTRTRFRGKERWLMCDGLETRDVAVRLHVPRAMEDIPDMPIQAE
jgi:hypothetical protein